MRVERTKAMKLVLIGGGHSHAIALKLWSQHSLPGVELVLISDVEDTPYSGMLPGYVAGFYTYQETHINLTNLAAISGAKLILDKAIALDLENNQVVCQNHQPVSFDYLSLDIGSTPRTSEVPGASEFAIPVKPVPSFLKVWDQLLTNFQTNPQSAPQINIIGGGAGGVELAFTMYTRLQSLLGKSCQPQISIIHRNSKLLAGHNRRVSRLIPKLLNEKGIKIYLNTEVLEIQKDRLLCQNNQSQSNQDQKIQIIDTDYTFWVTQADSPDWIKSSAFALDSQGFILVDNNLQSLSHPQVFATGDIATMKNYQRPKAGVFAVRQGNPLYQNWLNVLTNKPCQPYVPQDKYLALIGTGDYRAIASWGNLCWRSRLLWYLKDYIDRKFMNQFE